MKKYMAYIIAGVLIVGVVVVSGVVYMRYVAKKSPSIIGGGYDQEMQTKTDLPNQGE